VVCGSCTEKERSLLHYKTEEKRDSKLHCGRAMSNGAEVLDNGDVNFLLANGN